MITNPNEAYFKDGIWGWDGSQWRKLPLVWGYSERWSEQTKDLDPDAGTAILDTVAVGAGYVFVIEAIATLNVDKIVTHKHRVVSSVMEMEIALFSNQAANVWGYTFPVQMTLKQGDYVRAYLIGVDAGDDCYLNVWGYKMKIAE